MAIEFRDYYVVLGIARSAGTDEIRRAFRKLARLYHPDATGNDRRAEDKFKEINEAYEVLGDAERRKKYDEFVLSYSSARFQEPAPGWRDFSKSPGSASNQGQAEHFTFTGTGFSEFFDQLFGPNNARGPQRQTKSKKRTTPRHETVDGEDLETDLYVTLEEVRDGSTRRVTLKRADRCPTCFGMGQYNAHPCEQCRGKGSIIREQSFQVKVPSGVPEGACLRVPGHGEKDWNGKTAGDLYLKIKYARHPDFQVEQGQLVYTVELAPWEAVLGTIIQARTFDGKVNIKVPPGARHGQKLRVRGKGLPRINGTAGDLFVKLNVSIPSASNERERQLWEDLAQKSAFHPREN
jgi:curved DNA-binding protein